MAPKCNAEQGGYAQKGASRLTYASFGSSESWDFNSTHIYGTQELHKCLQETLSRARRCGRNSGHFSFSSAGENQVLV